MVFLIEFGICLMCIQMKDFQPCGWMGATIVNYFASVLNYEEVNRPKETNSCLFCHTDCFTEYVLCNTEYDDAERLENFESALFLVVEN
ncbi:hypothetical protein Hanom_Chr10g00919141 [Helianthus anomalus]